MTFIESQPATFPVFRGSVEAARSAAGKTVELRGIARNEGDAADRIFRVRVATAFLGWCINRPKRGCGQCPHPGLRMGLYRYRTGPDRGGFRGSGGSSVGEAGSSPISGTCFPRSAAFWPLSVDNLCCEGPLRGPFSLVAASVAGCLLRCLVGGLGAGYLFMGVTGWGNMT
jgi:hypothetical protein